MESGGEVKRSVLQVGGWSGVVAGVLMVVGLITGLFAPVSAGLEEILANFPDNSLTVQVASSELILAFLLILAFFAALYWSLREPSRVFARIGLGSGVLAAILAIGAFLGFQHANLLFSALYEAASASDRPLVVAAYAVPVSIFRATLGSGGYLIGLAIVASGLAMRGSPDFGEGLAWLSIIVGILVVLFTLLLLGPVVIPLIALFAIVLGWKVYSLSRAA